MDMIMVNLGAAGGPGAEVRVGDYATLYGAGGATLKETAALLDTAQSDITCAINRRVWMRYVNEPGPGIEPNGGENNNNRPGAPVPSSPRFSR